KLSLCLFTTLLAACGSGDNKSSGGGAAAPAKSPLAAIQGQADGVICPTFEGHYQRVDGNTTHNLHMKTSVENGKFNYSDGKMMILSDGQPKTHDTEEGKMTVVATCDAESFSGTAQ